jgi:hypothetical protein
MGDLMEIEYGKATESELEEKRSSDSMASLNP